MSNIYITSLSSYPLKSAAPLNNNWVSILDMGLQGDRHYVLTKPDGVFVTGRTHPKITSIHCEYNAGELLLSHASAESLLLNSKQFPDQYQDTAIWGTKVRGQRCGKMADQWISDLLGEPLFILYFGEKSKRKVINHSDYSVAFADGYPVLLTNQASLEHLNNRLLCPVTMKNFRPNITFSGSVPWAEDGWAKIKIGEVVFALTKPCSRCVFTTVDPATATLDPSLEPLKTLSSYRQEEGGTNVIFGENMLVLKGGTIKIGDQLEILETKPKPFYRDNWRANSNRITQLLKGSPLVLNDNKLLLRCLHIHRDNADVKTFTFCTDPLSRLHYQPGQFITIQVNIDGVNHQRCYTLSSSPSRGDTLSITVKRKQGGVVSNFLHDHFAQGSVLSCTKPSGQFHLKDTSRQKILMLSAGSGITPMLSMVRFITDNALNIDVHFHHSAKTSADFINHDELQILCERHPNFSLSYNLTRQAQCDLIDIDYHLGHLSLPMLRRYCPDLLQRDVRICGPAEYMASTKNALLAMGLPSAQYDQESFIIEEGAIIEDHDNETYKVNFTLSGIEVTVKGNQSIIEAAEEAGIYPDYSCLAGICGTCTSQLLKGDIYAPNARALDDASIAKGDFLPCCSYARSDLEVEL